MNTRVFVFTHSLVTASLAVFAWWQWQTMDALRAELTTSRIKLAMAAVPHPEVKPPAAAAADRSASPAAPTEPDKPTPARDLQRILGAERRRMTNELNDPRLYAQVKQRLLLDLDPRYSAFFRQLHLDPERLQTLKNLLIDRNLITREVASAPETLSDEERVKLREKLEAEANSKIAQALGQDVLNQMLEYERTTPMRHRVETIDQRLAYAALPLQLDQQRQLTDLLAQNPEPRIPSNYHGTSAQRDAYLAELKTYHAKLLASAGTLLTPEQASALAGFLQDEGKFAELRWVQSAAR